MESTIADYTAPRVTEKSSWQVSFAESCEGSSCLEKVVAELIFTNQQLRFILRSAQNQIEDAHEIVGGLFAELPEHPDIRRLHMALGDASRAMDL